MLYIVTVTELNSNSRFLSYILVNSFDENIIDQQNDTSEHNIENISDNDPPKIEENVPTGNRESIPIVRCPNDDKFVKA